ncbi:hypothetical protein [Mycolicibacterium fluoranthenivorans]|uniref:hypothetical protein n=1 Tax=Mycolicibacterium fluoranthenivorans TaxID=258505 RepID=UPI001F24E462|nr:hypothetical protein [Mycolicibacterium fluoranthenivorans]
MSVLEPLRPRGSTRGGVHVGAYRFGIGAGGSDWRWHAVDLEIVGPRMADAVAGGGQRGDVEVFSVCGTRAELVRRLGQFTYGSRWLSQRRCERCGWVVALNRGTVEAEIELHVGAAGDGDTGLLRQVFTSVLADVAPGRDAESGHRSDLLAHAALHRPTAIVCERCSERSSVAEVHGHGVTVCPQAQLVCGECTFTAGRWAGEREGLSTGECVVPAPCSVLVALARHYEIPVGGRR